MQDKAEQTLRKPERAWFPALFSGESEVFCVVQSDSQGLTNGPANALPDGIPNAKMQHPFAALE